MLPSSRAAIEVLPDPRGLARVLFEALDAQGEISSLQLVESLDELDALEVRSARQIAPLLTNSLRRRAKKLGLRPPWKPGKTLDGRKTWRDRDGIAARMTQALDDEQR